MKVQISADAAVRVRADALALPIFSSGDQHAALADVDKKLGNIIREHRKSEELKGTAGEVHVLPARRPIAAKRIILVGMGDRAKLHVSDVAEFVGRAVRVAARRGLTSVAVVLPDVKGADARQVGEVAAEGAVMATFEPAAYRSRREFKPDAVKTLVVAGVPAAQRAALKAGLTRGLVLGESANEAREMVNAPANDMTPTELAKRAETLAKAAGLKYHVLDRKDAQKLGMGSFLSVAAGSDEPPKVIALEYRGDKNSKRALGLVGKGITFDTGGISLKPALDMDAMKGDMAGGATVIGAMAAIGRLKPKVNVIGVIVATENMPSGKATKPGDVVRAMNGKTIEIINTDAEGRLVLADGMLYAKKLGATHLVDIATLTGAVVVALGNTSTGVMSNDRQFVDLFHRASAPYGERYWELPLFPEYGELIKSRIADMKNSGGRQAGTIFGAMFLKEFVDHTPWIHLDIAGTSWTDREKGHIAKGPTAVALRPLVALAESFGTAKLHDKADEAAHARLLT